MMQKLKFSLYLALGIAFVSASALIAAPRTASAAEVLKTGTLTGQAGHRSSGNIKIVRDGDKLKVVFEKNFILRDAPDATLAWGNNGYKRGTFFGKMTSRKGAQEYVIPAGTDLSKYNQFWIWCEKYNVALAKADLK